jgi:hypothetical protein
MEERLIETKTLANGLELSIYDASRKIAGDRWYVVLLARVVVPVKERFLGQGAVPVSVDEARSALGDTVVFEQRRERNFIDETEKQAVFDNLYQTFAAGTGVYIVHSDFPARFIKKRLAECLAKKVLHAKMDSSDDGSGL